MVGPEPIMPTAVELIDQPGQLAALLTEARRADRVALDIESNGLFAYRPRICTLQLAWDRGDGEMRVRVIDALALEPGQLEPLLSSATPIKVLHDLAFDARLLNGQGIMLRGVHDTAVAAAYLGKAATGLASLLSSELGVSMDKTMQVSDWGRRPLEQGALRYLAEDVEHLLALDDLLWARVREVGIEPEVQTECDYRLAAAYQTERAQPPPFARVKGIEKLDDVGKSVLKHAAEVRERMAEQAAVPPFKIAPDAVLIEIAERRPTSVKGLRTLGPRHRDLSDAVTEALLEAVVQGLADGELKTEDATWLEHPPFDRDQAEARKRREKLLSSWREAEAKRRRVSDQVVLPGHCLRRLAAGECKSAAQIAALEGFGLARTNRYAAQLVRLLKEDAAK